MRLPNLGNGTVNLSKVEFYPRLSEETLAFAAEIEIDGHKGNVQSDGHGGSPIIFPRTVHDALVAKYEAHAEYPELEVEGVIFGMIAKAADDHEEQKSIKRMIRKGYRYSFMIGDSRQFTRTAPTADQIAKHFGEQFRAVPVVTHA
jgi:hypothetical protein